MTIRITPELQAALAKLEAVECGLEKIASRWSAEDRRQFVATADDVIAAYRRAKS
jgi:hypothetical protein